MRVVWSYYVPATGVVRCLMHLNRICFFLLPGSGPVSGPVSEAYWGGGCISVMSKKVSDVLCKAPGESVLLEKSLVERKDIAPVMNILRLVTRAACLVLAEPFRASMLCCWGTPGRVLLCRAFAVCPLLYQPALCAAGVTYPMNCQLARKLV